jgi:hypothetical protein
MISRLVLKAEELTQRKSKGMAFITVTGIKVGSGDFGISPGDGELCLTLRAENEDESLFTLYQTISDENGVTWSKPVQIIRDDSGAPAHIFRHSSGVLISAFSHRSKPYGIWAVFSEDNGETWSDEFVIAEGKDTDDLGYPSTIQLDNGELITVFYTRENDYVPAVIMQQKWTIDK